VLIEVESSIEGSMANIVFVGRMVCFFKKTKFRQKDTVSHTAQKFSGASDAQRPTPISA
jgi:hypothetical protein